MKAYFTKFLFFISPILLFAACSTPTPVLRLIPYDQAGTWKQGLEYIENNGKGARMSIAFERMDQGDMVFDVEIENLSDESFLVDPRNFFAIKSELQVQEGYWQSAPPEVIQSRTLPAYDPEEVLLGFDKNLSRLESRRRNVNTASIITAIAAVGAITAVAVSASNSGSGDGGGVDVVADPVIYADFGNNQAEMAIQQDYLEHQKAYWQSTVLRKTTLDPGEKLRGRIYFPTAIEANVNYFFFPVGRETLQFIYRQERIDTRQKINQRDTYTP